MTVSSIAPTPSQWASASLHLERRYDWRIVRIDGERYVVLASATSGHVYAVRADAAGCGCPWYTRMGRQCAHMLALELAATEDELAEQPAPSPKKRASYADLFAACAAGCGELVERKGEACYRCASGEAHRLEMARKRELVANA